MWNCVSSSRLIHTPTSIGMMCTASSRTSAGNSRMYGSLLVLRRLFGCLVSIAGGVVTVAVAMNVLSQGRPRGAALLSRSLHLGLGGGEFGLDRVVGDRLATGGVGEQLLHRGADE